MTASARCTRAVLTSLFIVFLVSSVFAQQPLKFDAATVSGLPARNIGSATMSGRIAALDAVVRNGRLTMFVGSASGGVYKTSDGGKSWKKVLAGSNGSTGCGLIAMSLLAPKTIFASLWDFRRQGWTFRSGGPGSGLYVSTDGGEHWTELNDTNSKGLPEKPWGRVAVAVAPSKPNVVYANIESKKSALFRSDDGGKTWNREDASRFVIWRPFYFGNLTVDPKDENKVFKPDLFLLLSVNGGRSFSAVSQAAHGDFHDVWIDPSNSNIVYAGDDGGLWRSEDGGTRWKHQINLPVHMSPNEKGTIYIGAQFLFRSRDHGQSWERISPDLSTNDPEKQKQEESGGVTIDNSAAEMHTSIYSISESPKNGQIIWVGTDDGNLQITRDGAKTWANVVGNVPELPKFSWVSTIEASRFDEGTAYATFDRHIFGDTKPYLYKTTDYGKTWTALPVQQSGVHGYAHVIKEDTVDPNLLFLGTEFGLWISTDAGQRWAQYKGSDFPAVAVRDIAVHPRESDLVLATHGRGIWIIDDISSLRKLKPELMEKEAAVLEGPPAIQYFNANGGWVEGDESFTGPSRPTDAFITYYQKRRHIFGDLKIEIFDQEGKLLDTIAGSKHRGLNRAAWSMRLKAPTVPPAATALFEASIGPRVLPGTYAVKMTKGDQVYTAPLKLVLDPRAKFTLEDRKAQFDLAMKLYKLLDHMSYASSAIESLRDAATARAAKLPAKDALRARLQQLADDSDKLRTKIVATKEGGMITGEERIRELLGKLYGNVNNYEGRPTEYQVRRTNDLGRELEDVITDFRKLTDKELPAINSGLKKKKLKLIIVLSEADWQKQQPLPT